MNFIITRNILSSRLTGFDFFFFAVEKYPRFTAIMSLNLT